MILFKVTPNTLNSACGLFQRQIAQILISSAVRSPNFGTCSINIAEIHAL